MEMLNTFSVSGGGCFVSVADYAGLAGFWVHCNIVILPYFLSFTNKYFVWHTCTM